MTIYGEIRYADGTPMLGHVGTREPLDIVGRTVQEAVDDLATEIEGQGGLGSLDLDQAPAHGRLAIYAVLPDGTLHESGAASAPLRHRRRTPGPPGQYYRPWMGGREDIRSSTQASYLPTDL